MSWFTDKIKERYMGADGLDLGNVAKDVGVAGALYGLINPNDSSGIAKFLGTGGQQPPVGYTGGIPNYTATRELVPNAFASTYITPTGEVAPRRPGMAGRRYFTDTQFTQDTATPFMGITAEQIAAQNQAAIDDQALFESLLGGAATQRETTAAEQAAAQQAAEQAAAQQAAAQQAAAQQAAEQAAAQQAAEQAAADTFNTARDTNNTGITLTTGADNIPDEVDQGGITQTPREFYTSILDQIDASDGLDEGEQFAIADSIIEGAFGIDEIATRYNAQPVDVVEGLLRGGFQTPEEIVGLYNKAGVEDFNEAKLVATLLDQGKTTPEEVAAYYKDHPVYGGITPEQVIAAFKDLGGQREFAQGGNVNGYYLGGSTDGMADQIPATINNMQPAALSDGEFVIPADVVSHLGNGNSDSGAKELYSMMDRIRQDRTGTTKQGRQIDPNKYLA
jgi:hypothetical protein